MVLRSILESATGLEAYECIMVIPSEHANSSEFRSAIGDLDGYVYSNRNFGRKESSGGVRYKANLLMRKGSSHNSWRNYSTQFLKLGVFPFINLCLRYGHDFLDRKFNKRRIRLE